MDDKWRGESHGESSDDSRRSGKANPQNHHVIFKWTSRPFTLLTIHLGF